MPAFRRDHRVALEARAQRCELRGEGGALCLPHGAAPQAPATVPDPGRPAPGPRPGGAPPGWAGIDRRTDKSIDFCAEKLIDLLLAPRTREPPAGGAGDPSVLGGRAPGKPRDPQRLPPRGPRRLQKPTSLSSGEGGGKDEQEGPGGGTLAQGEPQGAREASAPRGRGARLPLRQAPSPETGTDRLIWEGNRTEASPQDPGCGRETWLGRSLARKRRWRPPGGGEALGEANGLRVQDPVRVPARFPQARSAGWWLLEVTQQVSGLRAAERLPTPPRGPPPPPAGRPHVSESAGAMGELGSRTTSPLYFGLISPTDLSPLSCQAKYFGLAGRAERARGPNKPIRSALGRGGRELGAAPTSPEIARPRAATCSSCRSDAPRGSGTLSRRVRAAVRGGLPRLLFGACWGLAGLLDCLLLRTLGAFLPLEASPPLVCISVPISLSLGSDCGSPAACGCLCVSCYLRVGFPLGGPLPFPPP